MYIVAEDPVSGSLVKLPGEVTLCKGAGEVIDGHDLRGAGADRHDVPEHPAARRSKTSKLHFFGGERAPLATPARCGSYTTHASFVPWAAEPWDEADRRPTSESTFDITSGPNGDAPCPGASLPFNPTATGGALNLQAGAFSPFTLTFSRSDGEQNLQSVEAHLPPGLSGHALERRTLPRTAGQRRRVRPEQPDRRNDRLASASAASRSRSAAASSTSPAPTTAPVPAPSVPSVVRRSGSRSRSPRRPARSTWRTRQATTRRATACSSGQDRNQPLHRPR